MLLLGVAFLLVFPLAGEAARRSRITGALPRLWWARVKLWTGRRGGTRPSCPVHLRTGAAGQHHPVA